VIRGALARVMAVILAATMMLAVVIALVRITIIATSVDSLPLRALGVLADVVVGTLLLLGCIWITTQLAVVILGVGDADFPPLPEGTREDLPPKN
jgi:hypothetical protein